jgi:hypothetical protein
MEKLQQTPIQMLIQAMDESMEFMPDSYVKKAVINCKELAKLYLYFEERAISRAFNNGERNLILDMYNSGTDSKFDDGDDYFKQTYIKNEK